MKIKTKVIKCNKTCDARMGERCMWKIDERLVNLAKDEEYRRGMCPILREEVEKIMNKKS